MTPGEAKLLKRLIVASSAWSRDTDEWREIYGVEEHAAARSLERSGLIESRAREANPRTAEWRLVPITTLARSI